MPKSNEVQAEWTPHWVCPKCGEYTDEHDIPGDIEGKRIEVECPHTPDEDVNPCGHTYTVRLD